jgi:thiol-disulfide isomerase/thioredoxin
MTPKRILAVALVVALAATFALAGKEDDRIAELEERIAALETKLAAVETQMDAQVDEIVNKAVQEIGMRDQNAQAAYNTIAQLAARGDQVAAKAQMTSFMSKYAGTDAAKSAARLNQELQVVGKPAPVQVSVEKWFTGGADSIDLKADGLTLMVFWEEWCPHCKREVPKMQATYDKFSANGLNVVALTKITKSSTDEKVTQFIQTNGLQFPIAKERGDLSQYFGVSGIPAAAVVKDGQIIWRGHPNAINDALIQAWLASSTASSTPSGG